MLKTIFVIIFGLAVQLFSQTAIAPSAGDGSLENPYQIEIWENLYWLSQNSTEWNRHYIQTNDIDFWYADQWIQDWDSGSGFTPIGNDDTKFTGSYNGQNNTIWALYINRDTTDYIGLFGYISDAVIENINITYAEIYGGSKVGGYVGMSYNSSVNNCCFDGSVTGSNGVGAIVGNNSLSTVSKCYAEVEVNGVGSSGGIVGYNIEGVVENSYSTGSVTRSSGADTNFGGFCGYNQNATIEYCYSTCDVFEIEGIVWSTLDKGFVGGEEGINNYNNNFFDFESSNQTSDAVGAAIEKTTVEMQTKSTFADAGWNFESIWDMSSSVIEDGYPHLKSENVILPVDIEPEQIGNVYQISSITHLVWIAEDRSRWSYEYLQTEDIDLKNAIPAINTWGNRTGFKPIGNNIVKFTGSFNGQNHIINGLYIKNSTCDNVGFFGCTENALIENIYLTSIELTGNVNVGGVCGQSYECVIQNTYSTGTATGFDSVGGIIGFNYGGVVEYSFSKTKVYGNDNAGSFIGKNTNASITNSYSTGYVVRNSSGVGTNFGGFLGYNNSGNIEHCFAMGRICDNPSLTVWITKDKGFLGGEEGSTSYINNFFNIETSGQETDAIGSAAGKSITEMQTQPTFEEAGWNFNDIWMMSSVAVVDGYPHLQWENVTAPVIIPPAQVDGIYQISTLDDLRWISEDSDRSLYSYFQITDIDCNEAEPPLRKWGNGRGFKTLGAGEYYYFKGSYNGNGYKILNLYINGVSLFGRIYFGSIIENLEISGTGSFASSNYGSISNCILSVNVLGGHHCGGLVGENQGSIINSSSSGSVLTGGMGVGGLVGINIGTIESCWAGGDVRGYYDVGGLVGSNYGKISNSYATGDLLYQYAQTVGGLVGRNNSQGGEINNSFSTGNVIGSYAIGGLCASNSGSVLNSFWDIETSGINSSAAGTGLTTAQMKILSTYTDAGWDFVGETANGTEDIWDMDGVTNNGYPYLSWQTFTGIEDYEELIPQEITLSQNYPNPFNPVTKISFSIPSPQDVELTVFNSKGQLVENLINKNLSRGIHSIQFNAGRLNSGIYFYRLDTAGKSLVNKMLLIK